MDRFTVTDGTDTATLTGDPEHPDVELRRWSVELDIAADGTDAGSSDERTCRMLEAATQAVSMQGGGRLEYWLQEVGPQSDKVPTTAGFTRFRDLLRLRRQLPALPTDLATRPFTAEDATAFLAVNNAAFEWHPEQGDMTIKDLESRQSEGWYDPEGFLLHEVDGEVVGFCWTKVHDAQSPALGEIYAIAVHPDHHGKGLGRTLTLAGLAHLAGRGLRHAILYVESDNRPARRMYEALGFDREFTNSAYQRIVR